MTRGDRRARFAAGGLYVVVTEAFCAGRPALDVLDACLDAGVRIVQLREKDRTDRALHDLARRFRERTAAAGALLIVNDRLDVALAAGADGVHLGQDDLPAAAARRLAPGLLVGVSTHSLDEALAAEADGAGYVNIGPVFATATKEHPGGAIGPEAISQIAPRLSVPFSVMGGIREENVGEVLARGARTVAVVTAVTAAPDVRAAAAALMEKIRGRQTRSQT